MWRLAWLAPSDLVAKIGRDSIGSLGVEPWAHRLANLGAPIVPPAPMIGATVLRIADRDVTFWRYAAQDAEPPLRSAATADSLSRLHAALQRLDPHLRTVADDLHTAIRSLDDEVFAPGSASRDRPLLQRAMRTATGLVDDEPLVVLRNGHTRPRRVGPRTSRAGGCGLPPRISASPSCSRNVGSRSAPSPPPAAGTADTEAQT